MYEDKKWGKNRFGTKKQQQREGQQGEGEPSFIRKRSVVTKEHSFILEADITSNEVKHTL